MNNSTMILLGCAVAAALCACAGDKTKARSGPTADQLAKMSDDQIAEQTITFMDHLMKVGESAKNDCAKMATVMKGVVDRHTDLLAVMRTYREDAAKSKWFGEHYGDRVKRSGMWFVTVPMKMCGKNAVMQEVAAQLLPKDG